MRDETQETGLYYMQQRYYDSGAGRFLNRDPIGVAGGLNLYGYVANNPVMHVDPTGLQLAGSEMRAERRRGCPTNFGPSPDICSPRHPNHPIPRPIHVPFTSDGAMNAISMAAMLPIGGPGEAFVVNRALVAADLGAQLAPKIVALEGRLAVTASGKAYVGIEYLEATVPCIDDLLVNAARTAAAEGATSLTIGGALSNKALYRALRMAAKRLGWDFNPSPFFSVTKKVLP